MYTIFSVNCHYPYSTTKSHSIPAMALKVSIIIANLIILNEVHALIYFPYKCFAINVYTMSIFSIPRFSHSLVLFLRFTLLLDHLPRTGPSLSNKSSIVKTQFIYCFNLVNYILQVFKIIIIYRM